MNKRQRKKHERFLAEIAAAEAKAASPEGQERIAARKRREEAREAAGGVPIPSDQLELWGRDTP